MESVLMIIPSWASANASARADLPLAVGPAISTGLLSCSEFTHMSLVATLICNPANPALDSSIVDGTRAILPGAGAARWLFNEVAVDIPLPSSDPLDAIAGRLRAAQLVPASARRVPADLGRRPND